MTKKIERETAWLNTRVKPSFKKHIAKIAARKGKDLSKMVRHDLEGLYPTAEGQKQNGD